MCSRWWRQVESSVPLVPLTGCADVWVHGADVTLFLRHLALCLRDGVTSAPGGVQYTYVSVKDTQHVSVTSGCSRLHLPPVCYAKLKQSVLDISLALI